MSVIRHAKVVVLVLGTVGHHVCSRWFPVASPRHVSCRVAMLAVMVGYRLCGSTVRRKSCARALFLLVRWAYAQSSQGQSQECLLR